MCIWIGPDSELGPRKIQSSDRAVFSDTGTGGGGNGGTVSVLPKKTADSAVPAGAGCSVVAGVVNTTRIVL